ncbi:MAG: hypothetical protein WA871_13865 [Candidatus Acidiferrales bacterium]
MGWFSKLKGTCGYTMRALALILIAASLPCRAGFAAPEARNPAQSVSAIEKSCVDILARDKTAAPNYSIGKDDPQGGTPGPWQTFASAADLKKTAADASFEDQAWVWESNGTVVHARISVPSQAWTIVADYCFRPDGTIGEITSDVQNFAVNEICRREWKFDSRGRIQDITEKYLDMDTGKPKKQERDFGDVDTTIYFKVADLPFAALLPKPGAQP